jgi:hypothetical protein
MSPLLIARFALSLRSSEPFEFLGFGKFGKFDIMMFSHDDLMRENDRFYFGLAARFGQEGFEGEAFDAR